MSMVRTLGEALLGPTSRRGFLAKATVAAAAMTVSADVFLKPGTPYAFICECAPNSHCDCSQLCCDGYTEFCCTINNGVNACPPGTFAGGWWKADGSRYCHGPRYYIDCQGECNGCSCHDGAFCTACDGLSCGCGQGDCNNWHVGCAEFRYGQCHQEIGCSGRIACRVVTCTPPWELDSTCSRTTHVDEGTADHAAPCQDGPERYSAITTAFGAVPTGAGYWLLDGAGGMHCFGQVPVRSSYRASAIAQPVVDLAVTPTGNGYWLVDWRGGVHPYGDAANHGSLTTGRSAPVVAIERTPSGGGYWLFDQIGHVYRFGDAADHGHVLQRPRYPIVSAAATPTGGGYWMIDSAGGMHPYGDAKKLPGVGDVHITHDVAGIAGTATGQGYWVVDNMGVVYTYGDAVNHGRLHGAATHSLVRTIVATSTGKGYWIVSQSGAVHNFGDATYHQARAAL